MEFAKTLSALAKNIGCSRETLSRWKNSAEGFPKPSEKGYDVALVKKWILENDKLSGNNAPVPSEGELYALKCRLARQDIEMNELDLSERRAELVRFDEVRALLLECISPLGRRLKDMPSLLAAKCNPADPTLAKEALREWAAQTNELITKQCKKFSK